MHPSDAIESCHSNCPDPLCRASAHASYIESRTAEAPEPNSGYNDWCTRKWLRIVLCICSAGFFGLAAATFGYCLHVLLNIIYPMGLILSNLSITIWLFIGITIYIAFVSILGFYVSWRNQKQTKLFAIGLAVAFILLFPTLCYVDLVRTHTLEEGNDQVLQQALISYLNDTKATNDLDFIQSELKCCGVTSYLDWNLNSVFNCSEDNDSQYGCYVPDSCCVNDQMENYTHCGEDLLHPNNTRGSISGIIYLNGCEASVLVNTLCWHLMIFAIILLASLIISVITIVFFLFMLQKEDVSLSSGHTSMADLPSIFGELTPESETVF